MILRFLMSLNQENSGVIPRSGDSGKRSALWCWGEGGDVIFSIVDQTCCSFPIRRDLGLEDYIWVSLTCRKQ